MWPDENKLVLEIKHVLDIKYNIVTRIAVFLLACTNIYVISDTYYYCQYYSKCRHLEFLQQTYYNV